jgi:hypothetical protein
MTEQRRNAPSPQDSDAARIDEICDAFEAAWLAGKQPKIEEYLERAERPLRERLLGELLPAELELRIRAGDQPSREEYVERFPRSLETVDAFFRGRPLGPARPAQLAGTAATQPRSYGKTPAGLQVRCPHCHNHVNVAADTPFTDICCSACGDNFSLVSEGISTRAAAPVTTK